VRLREAQDGDWAYILDSWSYGVPRKKRGAVKARARRLMRRAWTLVLVVPAVEDDEDDEICGWICFEDDCIHMMHVKRIYDDTPAQDPPLRPNGRSVREWLLAAMGCEPRARSICSPRVPRHLALEEWRAE
jgi:hypothetical protein